MKSFLLFLYLATAGHPNELVLYNVARGVIAKYNFDGTGFSEHIRDEGLLYINPFMPSGLSLYKAVFLSKPPVSLKALSILEKLHNMVTNSEKQKMLINQPPILYNVDNKVANINEMPLIREQKQQPIEMFLHNLDEFERKFYSVTLLKLTSIAPEDRQENGISFVQSGFYLLLTLLALSVEVDTLTKAEIDQCIGFSLSNEETTRLIHQIISQLPVSSDTLRFRRSSRLSLWPGHTVSQAFQTGPAAALQLKIDEFNATDTKQEICSSLNKKIEIDSGGAIHNTFDEDDVSEGVQAVLITMMYMRSRWRAAPTALNGTKLFRDAAGAPLRTMRMIRINDRMKYAYLREWDAEAIEMPYATPGLSLLMLVPREPSLRNLSQLVCNTSIYHIASKLQDKRIAVTVPMFTLRMTLLLPNKLQQMGISRLMDTSDSHEETLRLSHAVQRLMFWAEAGRNAYKDDGLEWDIVPEYEILVDRPYIFFVRWKNITIMNGHFVL